MLLAVQVGAELHVQLYSCVQMSRIFVLIVQEIGLIGNLGHGVKIPVTAAISRDK